MTLCIVVAGVCGVAAGFVVGLGVRSKFEELRWQHVKHEGVEHEINAQVRELWTYIHRVHSTAETTSEELAILRKDVGRHLKIGGREANSYTPFGGP